MTDYTFESFLADDRNIHAYQMAMKITENPGGISSIACFWGDTGCGKTHLLRAMEHAIREKKPELKVLYMEADDFCREFIDSVRKNDYESFRKKYDHMDVLFVDGIETIEGKEATQDELQEILRRWSFDRKQLVISSSVNPRKLEACSLLTSGIVERIKNRRRKRLKK